MKFSNDYSERVYAGVLGKLIGVYLGRPFEGWNYDRIMAELGEIDHYVHEQRGLPLVVTDDDISGTFTFIRALEDYDFTQEISAEQIGQTWLNYLIEGKTILSWAGLGCSTEHTAYLRLKHGIPAPASGSIALNGPIVAQQIGSQIFIDGWAMVSPGDPEQAAHFAALAGSVSHDGEALYGAQLLAAMEAQAFVETDRDKLLDLGLSLIPADSHMYRMVSDLREFHNKEPDWRKAREWIEAVYGYATYPGGCHIVPNSALIMLGYLYGDDDFRKSLMITNTSGWDTDCNSGNLGCLLGIKNGLAAIDHSPIDWRGPVADRMYLPSADGGRVISDAASETIYLVNVARRLAGQSPQWPKRAASPAGRCRFHFELPGSVQGFQPVSDSSSGKVMVTNVAGHSRFGQRSLAIEITPFEHGQRAAAIATATFIPPEALNMAGYGLLGSPSLYPGQLARAYLKADPGNRAPGTAQIFLRAYDPKGAPIRVDGPTIRLEPGQPADLRWPIPDTQGAPIYEIGLMFDAPGLYYLDALTWDGTPSVNFRTPASGTSQVWRKAWVNGVQHWEGWSEEPYRIVQNEGRGMLITGQREWQNYQFQADIRAAFLVKSGGIAAYVQGTRRYYGLFLYSDQCVRLVKEKDGSQVLAEAPLAFELWQTLGFRLQIENEPHDSGNDPGAVRIRAWVDGQPLFDMLDTQQPLTGGGIALVIEEGHLLATEVTVNPISE